MKKKDVLVAYHGGGYDGCFWEWNYFSYDSFGVFHNIFTSGHMGIKTEAEAEVLLQQAEMKEKNVFAYDLTKEADIDDFQDSHAVPHVIGIVHKLNAGEFGKYSQELFFRCDKCNDKVTDGGKAEDWHGCGGIESTADTKLCDDCYSKNTCSECGEYSEECEDHDGMCESCYESVLDDAISESKENYFFLEYSKFDNAFEAVEAELSDVREYIDDGTLYHVTIHSKDGFIHYLVDANSEENALEYVSVFLDRQYYTAEVELFNAAGVLQNV